MNVVSISNRWLNRLYKTVAIVLVLLAVIISAFRLFLPYVHHYKVPLQNYINQQSQTNISIGDLSMTWQRFGPVLVIGDVQILKTESAAVFIKQLDVQIDFWRTLTRQRLISKNLTLSGAKVDISEGFWLSKEESNGVISSETESEANDISVISDIFLNRVNRFSILDSEITIRNKTITRNLKLNKLNWLNTNDRHQAQGSVVLNELSSNNLQLKLDLEGDHGSELNGQVYLQANRIDITPWLDRVLVLDDDKTKTDINFSTWVRIKNSKINRLHIDFFDSTMHWLYENKLQQLKLGQGQFLLVKRKRENSFNLYSTELALTLNDNTSQHFNLMLTKETDEFSAYLSELDAGMFAQLTPLIVAAPKTRKLFSDLALTGKVEDLYIRHKENKIQAVAEFTNFNAKFSHGIPGVENVHGKLSYSDDYLALDFVARDGYLDFDTLFVQSFPYQKLSSQLNVAFADNAWELNVEALDFHSKEINLSAQINVTAPAEGEIELALLANVSNANAGLVGRYLPLPIMSDTLIDYLNSAVVSGRVEDAQVLINGPISRFPFIDNSGIFVVDAELSDAEFKFAENWPTITEFVANLNFTNNSMLITGRGGQLTGLDMTGVTAGIASLSDEQLLRVDAQIKPTAASSINDLMNQSPLKGSVGATLDHLNIGGNVSGEFHLKVPLNNSEQSLAQGNIIFDNNQIALQSPQLLFKDVAGQLSFNNDEINTQELQLTWYGLPVAVDITGRNKVHYYDTEIELSALWQEPDWQAYLPTELRQYVKGELPWNGHLSLYQHYQGGFSYKADFSSDLNKTALLLPAPYAKAKTEKSLLTVQLDGQVDSAKIALKYSDELHFSGVLNHDTAAFSHANLMLGDGMMALPRKGFHITTQLDSADFSQWQPVISNILDVVNQPTTTQSNSTPLIAKPERIRGTIGQLKLLGKELNNVNFNLIDKTQWWLLQLNAKETRSQVKIFPDFLAQGLEVNSEFLHLAGNAPEDKYLTKNKGSDEAVNFEVEASKVIESPKVNNVVSKVPDKLVNDNIFQSIPPLVFHCDSCSVGKLNLGTVDMSMKRLDQETIEFSHFKAKRKNAELTLTGQWQHNEKTSKSSFQGQLSVEDLEAELKALSFASIIRDSGADVDFNLSWLGGLHNFSVNHLNGDINAKIDDGYLADVPDTARIFSVLSLQSLVRKLTFDFRDIFSDGMFYSDISGDYHLSEGIISTDNTEMAGTAGDLFMMGHTNLVSGELDYDMTYKPNLTSSLPVLAWIATLNPVTFLAGVAIDQVIQSQVVSEFNFELTGTVEEPNFLEVNRKNKDISIENNVPDQDEAPIEETINLENSSDKESTVDQEVSDV